MDTLESLGISAFASRMKRLSDGCFEQVKQVYDALSVDFEPAWYPYVMYVHHAGSASIGDLVNALGVSQPAASVMVKKLVRRKFFTSKPSEEDARGRVVALTPHGKQTVAHIAPIVTAMTAELRTIEAAGAPAITGVIDHLACFENAFRTATMHRRAITRLLKELPLSCVPYEQKWHHFYETHNRAWVEKYFAMEPSDEAMLKDPKHYVLDRGGQIYIVCLGDYPVGGFSLIPHEGGRMEISKMYVPFALQGFGIGKQVMRQALAKAESLGLDSVFLLSNTMLGPAIHLYRSHGFAEQPVTPEDFARYKRVNIRMEKRLKAA